MNPITVCIPVSPYHIDLLPQAVASVRAQTMPCETLVFYDEDKRGAGYARNELLKLVKTDLLIFLDADDQLAPTFAEKTFALYAQTKRYIYTDWDDETGKRYGAPDCAWANGSHHLITTLLPTAWARAVGGFDEALSAAEDSDFYTHLVTSGYCGLRLAETLVTYTHFGQRSQAWFKSAEFNRIREQLAIRYRGKHMGCCDGAPLVPPSPMGERVLVVPTWGLGTRGVIGMATGVNYGRLDASTDPVWMDRRDVEIRPGLFRILQDPKTVQVVAAKPAEASDNGGGFKQLVARLNGAWGAREPSPAPRVFQPTPAAVVEGKPNIERVLRLTGAPARKGKRDLEPVFVFPDKAYPSYTDALHLVQLSGFDTVVLSEAEATFADTYIYLSPEQPPVNLWGSRHIWWSLEYGGEYEPDLTNWQGEVWASDPAWAKAHDAKFVVMGSHPDLGIPNYRRGIVGQPFDVTMLGYMTPRREQLKTQLNGLAFPEDTWGLYPGYGDTRHQVLDMSSLMLHAHQDEQRRAIAPQRFALCAAYHLPLIHESVPDEGAYAGAALFAEYDLLAATTRATLRDSSYRQSGDALHEWLCKDLTFRKSVEEALRD